jgi:hypothetical protein
MMIASLYKGILARVLQRIVRNFDGLLFSAILIQTADVKIVAGNGHARSDLFPSTHWSVVLAAGESQAESETAQAALAELCQTYWAPPRLHRARCARSHAELFRLPYRT